MPLSNVSHSTKDVAPIQPKQPMDWAESSAASEMPPSLRDKNRFALDLATHHKKSTKNHSSAPAFIAPLLKSLTILNSKPGTQSAQLSSFFKAQNPLRALTDRVEKAVTNPKEEYQSSSAAILPDNVRPRILCAYSTRREKVHVPVCSKQTVDYLNNLTLRTTKGLIPGNLEFQDVSNKPVVLVNNQYLYPTWKYPFDKRDTMLCNFKSTDEKTREVPTMHKTFRGYELPEVMKSETLQAVKIPCQDKNSLYDKLSLILVMKTDNTLTQPTSEDIKKTLDQLKKPHLVNERRVIAFPKFTATSQSEINKIINKLNLKDCLNQDPQKNHTGIYKIVQNCVIKVDEKDTKEAPKKTRMASDGTAPSPQCHFSFDKPFTAMVCLESKIPNCKGDVEIIAHAHINYLENNA